MQTEVNEVVSAFVDGEPVEAGELGSALAGPGGREALLDFMLLRARLADGAEPSPVFVARMRRRLGGRAGAPRGGRIVRLAAVAAVLMLATLGALDLARSLRGDRPHEPPEPTRVIRYEPGVDWHDSEG
jgi:hypothetical protein